MLYIVIGMIMAVVFFICAVEVTVPNIDNFCPYWKDEQVQEWMKSNSANSLKYLKLLHKANVKNAVDLILGGVGLILIVLGLVLECHNSIKVKTVQPVLYSTEKIIALQDNNDIAGTFYLRSGSIDTVPYYYYMVKLSNGGYANNKVPASHSTTTVYEITDNSEPRVEWYKKSFRYIGTLGVEETVWKIYIPEGTIQNIYNIDLQ